MHGYAGLCFLVFVFLFNSMNNLLEEFLNWPNIFLVHPCLAGAEHVRF